MRFVMCAALALLAAGAAGAAEIDVTDGRVWMTVDGVELKVDIYQPRGTGPFAGVVYLHGGGWSGRNRKQLRRQAAHMAELGVAGFAFEYRVSGEASYPAAVIDAKAAVRWVRAHAAEFQVDTERIGAVGSSAGGHLVAMLGLTAGDAKFEGGDCCREFSSRVKVVAAFNPVLDLSDPKLGSGSVAKFLGAPCAERLPVCQEASPIYHASRTAAPMLILHGTADATVPFSQAVTMTEKLKLAGATVELYPAEGGAHTFWATPEWYEKSEHAMEVFLLRYLKR